MKHYYPPFFSTKRDKRVAALLRQGHATEEELTEAQFGGPVRGLHKDTPQTGLIEFKDFWKDPQLAWTSYLYRQAYIRGQPSAGAENSVAADYAEEQGETLQLPSAAPTSTIYVNRPMMSPGISLLGLLSGRAVAARAHDIAELALDSMGLARLGLVATAVGLSSSFRYAMASSYLKGLRPSIADAVCEEQAHGWMLRDQNSWIMRDAFRNAAENHIARSMSAPHRTYVHLMQGLDMIFAMMPVKGYKSDSEKSPRLYNIIARNYQGWGKIAENPEEFVAMLIDAGVRMPHFGEWYQPSRYIDANLLNPKGYLNAPTAELNVGLNATRSQEVLRGMWEWCLPLLYADILVNLGDSKGYQRMGFDPDTRDVYGIPQPMRPPEKQDLLPPPKNELGKT